MGLSLFSNDTYTPPNPNPYGWVSIKEEQIGKYTIIEAKYIGCTTFNGHKLMLLRNKPYVLFKLDPHLLGQHHYVMARFEPTKEGWELARLCAEKLNEFTGIFK